MGRRASADLTPATGARTTRLYRTQIKHRSSACHSSAHGPCRPALPSPDIARRCRVHRIPPRVNDDGQRPSVGRDGGGYRSDLGKAGTEIFLQRGLDSNSAICPSGSISGLTCECTISTSSRRTPGPIRRIDHENGSARCLSLADIATTTTGFMGPCVRRDDVLYGAFALQ